jgi:FMN phosphatase YigB (HAD superfamily)
MVFKLVILDFDGTFSDAEAEAAPFVESFQRDVFDLLGRVAKTEDAQRDWQAEADKLRAEPTRYGWRIAGVVAAPAISDPYLRSAVIAQNLCDAAGVLRDEETRSAVLQALYSKNYPRTLTVPRPDAKRVLETLLAGDRSVYVVTNSRTDAVQAKIDRVAPKGLERLTVIGDAKKFVVDDVSRGEAFDTLQDLALPGLDERNVAIKRGPYYEVLERCWRESGASAAETLVCGDIFELDLALPLVLGAHVHLVHHADTPAYEVDYVSKHERGAVSRELAGVLARL